MVTGTVVPAVAVVGEIVEISGASANTVNVTGLLVLPTPGVVTVMVCAPSGALPAISRVAVSWLKLDTGVPTTVMPVGRFKVPNVRPVPAMVIGTVAPVPPVFGVMLVITGTAGKAERNCVAGAVYIGDRDVHRTHRSAGDAGECGGDGTGGGGDVSDGDIGARIDRR